MARFDLSGKTALVAGASRGIGAAIAHGLAEHGAHVVCTSRKVEDCQAVADEITAGGGSASAMTLHLGKLEQHQPVIDAIRDAHGRLDILINNGGTNVYQGPATETPETAYDKTFEVNLKGPFFLSVRAIPLMIEGDGGSIVNVSSIDAVQPGLHRVTYGMTKAAMVNMTKGLAKEFGEQGIRVNALLPGFTDTRLAGALKDDPDFAAYVNMKQAIKRMATPEEMVGAVLYMVSDEASFFTGQGIVVDGGALI